LVKYTGEVIIELSHPVPSEFSEKMGDIINELNTAILRKGTKADIDAAKIISYEAKDRILRFNIIAGRIVGAHVAALRIKNYLSPMLGKEYRIGIRDVVLKNAQIELSGE